MLEVKTYTGSWKKVTKEIAEKFYKVFYEEATDIDCLERHTYFNKNYIRGGRVLLNGKVITDEEIADKMFQTYKNDLIRLSADHGEVRFTCIEYTCSFPDIDPYEMAASLIKDGIKVVYDDSSISKADNDAKERKVKEVINKKEKNK